ncbi:MAG: asparagine--tRNA ligase, partial [Spirochaetes bacterium]|nr:asparagine--tRNA ligase [Spirochaetota bacterium]
MIKDGFRIADSADYAGTEAVLKGWVSHIRSSGSLFFIEVRDGTGFIQAVVVKSEVSEQTFELCSKLKIESSLIVRGMIREDSRAPGGFEM